MMKMYICAGLAQQNYASDMCSDASGVNSQSMLPTQQPNIEDSSCSSSSQPEDKDGTQSMESRLSRLSSGNDALPVAFNVLERAARQNGFSIHDVP